MKTKFSFLLFILCFSCALYAQYNIKQNYIWAFGTNAGLNFNTGTGVPITTKISGSAYNPFSLKFVEGSASICNANGNLLFYCTGDTIWNKFNQVMPNAVNLCGGMASVGWSATQGALIVPVMKNKNQYYVFSLEGDALSGNGNHLYYSIVDMTLNGGLGGIVTGKKSILVDQNLNEKMIAVPGPNCEIWLLTHARNTKNFKARRITAAGISAPIISIAGNLNGLNAYDYGEMKISPDYKKLAITSTISYTAPGSNTYYPPGEGAEICDFDVNTGIVSNSILLDSADMCYGACFSPDNSKLYISATDPGFFSSRVQQYDLSLGSTAAIKASVLIVNYGTYLSAIRHGPDDKLYLNGGLDYNYIDRIDLPNAAGTACNYMWNAIPLNPGTTTLFGLTNQVIVATPLDTAYSLHDSYFCNGSKDTLQATAGFASYAWDNDTTKPTRVVTNGGNYWALAFNGCHMHMDTFHVSKYTINFSLGNDTIICNDLPLTIDVPGASYFWQDSSTANSYTVTQSGTYSLRVNIQTCFKSDSINITYFRPISLPPDTLFCREAGVSMDLSVSPTQGASVVWSDSSRTNSFHAADTGIYWVKSSQGLCVSYDTIHITDEFCNCTVFIPDAFTPNDDKLNDDFRPVIQNGCSLSGYQFYIYDRWGKELFFSKDPAKAWDGIFAGQPMEMGAYRYMLKCTLGYEKVKTLKFGDFTLIR